MATAPIVDPVRGRQHVRAHRSKRPAEEDEPDDEDVEHRAGEKKHEAREHHDVGPRKRARRHRPQHRDRFRGYRREKPGAVQPMLEPRFGLHDGDGGKERVDEDRPQHEASNPERRADRERTGERHALRAEHAGAGNDRQERGPGDMVTERARHGAWRMREPRNAGKPQQRVGDEVDGE
ncbi:MAG TPA: hypothetical protein VFO53_09850 [Casimicrobiaceae bacterium]|nr:hypothetical protein [Casimicrobiaceae bacterium]